MNERDIFIAALNQRDPAERAAFLDRACGDDRALRQRVEELLREQEQLGSFLERPAEGEADTGAFLCPPDAERAPVPAEGPGTVIGPYKLIEEIGEGGMGTVYMAQQTGAVKRLVALKLIRPGMDSRQVIARFEAERQALALMDHPNIARVFDAGSTGSGRPYFVMELVKGVPLTQYCDAHRLTPKERLELFVPVCQAIQHAHQKGIIHRDIKPSNVLVALYDGKPVPKVIDFGVAKATGQQLTEHTLVTGFGAVVGTLEYMSPEQAEVNQLDIDTRSDIYSLGVLLYELLTGSTPLERKRLKQAALLEVLRLIREEEPPRPSTRLSDSKDSLASVSAQRNTEPAKLTKLVRGELDWIVMKALEKDRNRRYETANGLAMDVQRYLADEAVQACPPSAWYRFRKFARRNKGRLTGAVALVLAFVLVAGSLGWAARDRAAVAAQVAHDRHMRRAVLEGKIGEALDETEAAYERDRLPEALAALRRAEALCGRDNEVGDEIRQRVGQWRAELTVLQHLEDLDCGLYGVDYRRTDAAFVQVFLDIGIDVDGMPVEEAGRRIRIRRTWKRLAEALDSWAIIRQTIAADEDFPADAVRRRERLYQVARATDKDDLRSQARLAAEKWDIEAAERLAGSPEVSQLPADTLRNLATVIYFKGGEERGRERAIRLLVDNQRRYPDSFRVNVGVASSYTRKEMKAPQWAEAAHYAWIAVALRPENALARGRVAYYLRRQGKLDEAVAQFRTAIALDPKLAGAHYGLGIALKDQGKLDEAIAECRKAIELDPKNAMAHNNLGAGLHEQGKLDEAIAECRQAIELDPKNALAHINLGNALWGQGKLDEAIAECRQAIELDPKNADAHNNLGNALWGQGKWNEAIAEFRQAIALDPNNATVHRNLGKALGIKGQLDEAIAEYREAIRIKKDDHWAHYNLGNALRIKGQLDSAVAEYREAIAIKSDFAEAHWNLGLTLQQQGQFREALQELRRSHELGFNSPNGRNHSAQWVRRCERLIELDGKLPSFLAGKITPASAGERIELAWLCSLKRLNGAAARFYEQAFAAEPKLADDLGAGHRYNAACAAALAGCGQGKDADNPDDKERDRRRRQALDWLRADLESKRLLLEKEADKAGPYVIGQMRHWLADPDLASVRGPEALAKLPAAERQSWQHLWKDVAATLQQAQQKLKK